MSQKRQQQRPSGCSRIVRSLHGYHKLQCTTLYNGMILKDQIESPYEISLLTRFLEGNRRKRSTFFVRTRIVITVHVLLSISVHEKWNRQKACDLCFACLQWFTKVVVNSCCACPRAIYLEVYLSRNLACCFSSVRLLVSHQHTGWCQSKQTQNNLLALVSLLLQFFPNGMESLFCTQIEWENFVVFNSMYLPIPHSRSKWTAQGFLLPRAFQ